MRLTDVEALLASEIDSDVSCESGTRPSSVLVIIYGENPAILMTKKASHLKIHAGEIAFPGGKPDADDADLLHTALREAHEELGIEILPSRVIGQLGPVRTLNSNYTIVPFVCILDRLPDTKHNCEVDSVLHIPAFDLLSTLRPDPDPANNIIGGTYVFMFQDHVIWGASARILKQIVNRMKAMGFLCK